MMGLVTLFHGDETETHHETCENESVEKKQQDESAVSMTGGIVLWGVHVVRGAGVSLCAFGERICAVNTIA